MLGGSSYFSNYLLWNLEHRIRPELPERIDGIILLGGSISHLKEPLKFNQISLGENAERIVEAIYLLNKNPQSKIIFCDNKDIDQSHNLTEGYLNSFMLRKFSINDERIIILDSAQNTFQESINISEHLLSVGGNWVLITSASHMPRSILLFQSRKLGRAVIYPYPTDYSTDKPKIFAGRYTFHLINSYGYTCILINSL